MGHRDRTEVIQARECCNPTWLGTTVTVTDRADGREVTDRIGDYWHDPTKGHVWFFMPNAGQVELRATDTVLYDGLGLLGGASA